MKIIVKKCLECGDVFETSTLYNEDFCSYDCYDCALTLGYIKEQTDKVDTVKCYTCGKEVKRDKATLLSQNTMDYECNKCNEGE